MAKRKLFIIVDDALEVAEATQLSLKNAGSEVRNILNSNPGLEIATSRKFSKQTDEPSLPVREFLEKSQKNWFTLSGQADTNC